MTSPQLPRVLVLLATHNGAAFLREQLESVLAQDGVEVHVLISDDGSTDATPKLIGDFVGADARVRALPPGRFGSAAANFARLIQDADLEEYDAVALCDQDDRWTPWKLARHAAILFDAEAIAAGEPVSAVSSNVVAFDEQGLERIIVKDQPQRLADYAFESGGPGSTYLLGRPAFRLVQQELRRPDGAAARARAHDWLIYALVRASGGRWVIDHEPSVEYRQHDANVLGANEGATQHWRRLRKIIDGSYRQDVSTVVAAAEAVAVGPHRRRLASLRALTARRDPLSRLRLARRAGHFRRRRRDQLVLTVTLLFGLW